MKALVWQSVETMVWKNVEKPIVKDEEILIKVKAVGICGSEIEGYLGHNSLRIPPLIMGHEFCGFIAELGKEVSGFAVGQKVVVNPLIYCTECNYCRKGMTQLCANRKIIGIHRSGAFAEYVSVPATNVFPIPDHLDVYRASLTEPLACSLRATRRALERHPFSNVVIFGAGGIGLLCGKVARILGADKIVVIDTNVERLNIAMQAGVDYTINPSEDNYKEKINQFVGNKGIDVVIDAAGFQPTRSSSIEIINPGGTFMNIGLGVDETELPINYLIRNEIEILGSFSYSNWDFQDALDLLINGKVTENGWTEVREISKGDNAFKDLINRKVAVGKIFLDVEDSIK